MNKKEVLKAIELLPDDAEIEIGISLMTSSFNIKAMFLTYCPETNTIKVLGGVFKPESLKKDEAGSKQVLLINELAVDAGQDFE